MEIILFVPSLVLVLSVKSKLVGAAVETTKRREEKKGEERTWEEGTARDKSKRMNGEEVIEGKW